MTYGSDVLPFDDEDADADADKDVEVERKVAAESRISSSKEDDQEEHVDYANYFWLRLLLLASAIDHNLTPNPKFQLLNKCVNCLVAVVFGMELVHIMYIQIKTQTVYYVPIGMVLWVFHSVIVFTVVSSSMRKKLSLLTIIPELVKEEPASLRPVSLQNVPKMIRADGICTFCVCFVNVLITAFNWNLIWEALPLSTHISYILSLCFVHYIYSICWFLAVPFLHVSCYIMTKKIENFKEFLEEAVMENRPLDIRHVMQWYKELYNSNKKLSSLISPLMTTSFILIGMLIVVMLMVRTLLCHCLWSLTSIFSSVFYCVLRTLSIPSYMMCLQI